MRNGMDHYIIMYIMYMYNVNSVLMNQVKFQQNVMFRFIINTS